MAALAFMSYICDIIVTYAAAGARRRDSRARVSRGLTQAELAASAGLSRQTLNSLENGLVKEIGIRKVLALLDTLGIELSAEHGKRPRRPDYIRMASTTASVSFRSTLTEDELIRALLSGDVPANKAAHVRTLFDEAPAALLNGLAAEAGRWMALFTGNCTGIFCSSPATLARRGRSKIGSRTPSRLGDPVQARARRD